METLSTIRRTIGHEDHCPIVHVLTNDEAASIGRNVTALRKNRHAGLSAVITPTIACPGMGLKEICLDVAQSFSNGSGEEIAEGLANVMQEIDRWLEWGMIESTGDVLAEFKEICNQIRRGTPYEIEQRGADTVLSIGHRIRSLLGLGDSITARMYAGSLSRRRMQRQMNVFNPPDLEGVLHRQYPDAPRQHETTRSFFMQHLTDHERERPDVTFVPAYSPQEPENPDIRGIRIARHLGDFHNAPVACLLHKDCDSVYSADGDTVAYYFGRSGRPTFFNPDGPATDTVRDDAIKLAHELEVPLILVRELDDHGSAATLVP